MADQLYLSYWIHNFTEQNMLRHFEAVLKKFPFSRLKPLARLRIYVLELAEPPALEREFAGPEDLSAVIEAAGNYLHDDCAYLIDTAWDIWQFDTEWKLKPAQITLICYGPRFQSEFGEQLLIEVGSNTHFLPQSESSTNLAPIRHNIRGLLHLVEDLDKLPFTEKRKLWSESGRNFAALLSASLNFEAI